jgi:hypothetical protein
MLHAKDEITTLDGSSTERPDLATSIGRPGRAILRLLRKVLVDRGQGAKIMQNFARDRQTPYPSQSHDMLDLIRRERLSARLNKRWFQKG